MKSNKGFTLVELLVVMAIIAILASITIPNVIGFIRGARATRALTEISSIETSLTKMLADAGRSELHHLFNPEGVRNAAGIVTPMTTQAFDDAVKLYTNTLYALLREGRQVLNDPETVPLSNGFSPTYAQVLRPEVINKLGIGYMEVPFDPWGNLYNIYPGPWPGNGAGSAGWAIPFRIFTVEETADKQLPGSRGGAQQDALTTNIPDAEAGGLTIQASFAAPRNQIAYIWSYGANLLNGQAIYQSQYDNSQALTYYAAQEDQFKGGGDDVNNWDKGRSWERFYN